jgi:hypothetical protein
LFSALLPKPGLHSQPQKTPFTAQPQQAMEFIQQMQNWANAIDPYVSFFFCSQNKNEFVI